MRRFLQRWRRRGWLRRRRIWRGLLPGHSESAVAHLKANGFAIAACVPYGGVDLREAPLTGRLAIALGREGSGLPEGLLQTSDLRLSVPMKGEVDSLNVAVVAGLVLYEAARRRGIL